MALYCNEYNRRRPCMFCILPDPVPSFYYTGSYLDDGIGYCTGKNFIPKENRLSHQGINFFSQLPVFIGNNITCVVRGKPNFQGIVYIGP